MKFPILYEQNETDFFILGLGPLTNSIKATVTEERNGAFYFEGEVLTNSEQFKLLKNDMIIKADAGHTLKNQRFRIKRIVDKHDGVAEIYAEHISYLAQELSLKPEVSIKSADGNGVITRWKNSIIDKNPFVVDSDVTTTASTKWEIGEVDNAREALGGVKGSILDNWGGEYRFDNYHISLLQKRGKPADTLLAYGRNITDFEQERNITNTYTSVFPFARYTDDKQSEHLVTIDNYIVDSKYVDNYPNRKALPVDFSDKFEHEEKPTKEKLVKLAETYIKSNEIGIPKTSIRVSFLDLSKASMYDVFQPLEQLSLCDDVRVEYPLLGVSTVSKVIKTVWNVLTDSYDEIEIGEKRTTLSTTIKEQQEAIKEVEKNVNGALVAANGKNMVFYGLYGENGLGEPVATMIGDMWYKPVGEDTELYIWNGTIWEFIMSTAPDDTIKEKIEELEQTSKDISESVDKALEEAEIARQEAFNSEKIANEAKADASKAQSDIANVKAEADKKLEEAGKELETINGKVEKQGLTINKLDDELQVQSAKVEANTASVASLKLESDRIATEVIKTNEKVDNIEVGGRNYVLQSHKILPGKSVVEYDINLPGLFVMKNQIVTVSFEAKADVEGDTHFIDAYLRNFKNGQGSIVSTTMKKTKITDRFEKYHFSFKVREDVEEFEKLTLAIRGNHIVDESNLGKSYSAQLPKLEKGAIKSDWTPAPEDKASQSEVTKVSTQMEQTAELVKIKADKSEVDTINKTVKENKAQIEVHNEQIQLKASQSEVDKINDTVKVHESEIKIHSEQIKLQTSKIDNHSTEIANIKVESDKISSTVSKVEKNLNVSGTTNLILDSDSREIDATAGTSESENYRYTTYYISDSKSIEVGTELTFRFFAEFVEGGANNITIFDYPTGGRVNVTYSENEEMSLTFIKKEGTDKILVYAGVSGATKGNKLRVTKAILHRGSLYADWSPAPEDLATQIEMSNVTQTVKGLQVTVQDKANQSEVTIMSNQLNSTIKRVDGTESKVTQLSNQLDFKVSANEVISRINMSPERIRIDSKLIHLSGQTLIDDAVIKNAMIANGAINNAKIQDASISDAKIISITANKVVARDLSAITTNTGTLNISGWMSILTDNMGIRGSFDYGDTAETATFQRWHEGDFSISHRVLAFKGHQWKLRTNGSKGAYHGWSESTYGMNHFKSRLYTNSSATSLIGRVDIRDDFIQVNDNWVTDETSGTWIKPNYIVATSARLYDVSAKPSVNYVYFNEFRKDLADFRIGKDGVGKAVVSEAIYNRTYNSQPTMCITDEGRLGRIVSAKKYKDNIEVADDVISKSKTILSIEPKSWTAKNSDSGIRHYGFIADDFHELDLKEVVLYSHDEVEGLSYDRITMYHNVVLSEHEKEIESLKRRIEKLEEELDHAS